MGVGAHTQFPDQLFTIVDMSKDRIKVRKKMLPEVLSDHEEVNGVKHTSALYVIWQPVCKREAKHGGGNTSYMC